jgi:hypothetical protein
MSCESLFVVSTETLGEIFVSKILTSERESCTVSRETIGEQSTSRSRELTIYDDSQALRTELPVNALWLAGALGPVSGYSPTFFR